jgi:peptidoglycan/xylan/chitin deacetylase (PgdA/CDA1 family)
MTLLYNRRFSSWARGHLVFRVDHVSDRFALTFDDGPGGPPTVRILDALARRGARATFFLLGSQVRRYPDLIPRMVAEGHEVGVHGDDHWPLAVLPPGAIRHQIQRCVASIVAAGGPTPLHYRPPFGFMMPGQSWFVRRLGLTAVLGDVYPEDAQNPGVDVIIERVDARLTGGSILILHDASAMSADRRQTLAALDPILDLAEERGLRAVTVAELLAIAPER